MSHQSRLRRRIAVPLTTAVAPAIVSALLLGTLPAAASGQGAAAKPTPAAEAQPSLPWWKRPLSDRLNAALDSLYAGFNRTLLGRHPSEPPWWEDPLADRLNRGVDRMQERLGQLRWHHVAGLASDLGVNGPVIWPNKTLDAAQGEVDPGQPLSLLAAWRAARSNDPTLRAARAALSATQERLPQARSQMLPQIQLGISRFNNDLRREGSNALSQPLTIYDRYPSSNDTLSLRQPLLRPVQVLGVRQAEAGIREAQAQFAFEEQNLSVRLVGAYLEVLLAHDSVALYESQRSFLESALEQARRGMMAGVGTRTDVDAAQAKLDLNVAQALEARQQLELARRQLQAYINRPLGALVPLDGSRLAALGLTELSLDDWRVRAERGSPEIARLRAQREAAGHELNKARSGHLPTLDLVAQMQRSRSENTLSPQSRFENTQVGVQLNVPLYNGGYHNSVVRQVGAEIERIDESLEALRLDLGVRIHREYRGVTEGLARVRALEVAVRSADVALDSARRSVVAGVRSSVDVLNAEQQRMQALRDLAQARYTVVLSLVRLQGLAGETDEMLITRINSLLKL